MQREPFDPADFERLTEAVPWLASVHAYAQIGSTNDEAARLARQGASEGTVVVADQQTAGRGRLDRTWSAEPGTSLLASWIVRPEIPPEDRALLSLAAAAAVAAAVEQESGVALRIKWPNDLLADGRKIAGILSESLPDGAVVVGLGLNVRQDGFQGDLARSATSLLLQRSRPVGRARLLGAILNSFAPYRHAPRASLEHVRMLCDTIGCRVRVDCGTPEPPLEGTAVAIRDDGALMVASEGGETAVAAGDVVHVRGSA